MTAGLRPAMPAMLDGKVVVVSGVGEGLGRSVAVRSALAGARVVLAARTESRLTEVAEEIRELGGTALCVPTDLTDDASVLCSAPVTATSATRRRFTLALDRRRTRAKVTLRYYLTGTTAAGAGSASYRLIAKGPWAAG